MYNKILTVVMGSSLLLLVSCGGKEKGGLEEKKAQLATLKDQQEKLNTQITALEDEIGKQDSSASKEKAKLVSLTPLAPTSFTHFIDLQGSVEADNTSYISPRGQGGVVKQVFVKQGDHVSKGQLLMKLD